MAGRHDHMSPNRRSANANDSSYDDDDSGAPRFYTPTHGASPLRCASSLGFSTEMFNSKGSAIQQADVQVFGTDIVNTAGITVPARLTNTGIIDVKRMFGDQQLLAAKDTVSLIADVDPQDDTCQKEPCPLLVRDFPLGEISRIKSSARFRPVQSPDAVAQLEQALLQMCLEDKKSVHFAEEPSVSVVDRNEPTKNTRSCPHSPHPRGSPPPTIMRDEAVVSVNGIKNPQNNEHSGDPLTQAGFHEFIDKLHRAVAAFQVCEKAGIHISVDQPPVQAGDSSNVKEYSGHSDSDKTVCFTPQTSEAGTTIDGTQTPRSLNPNAAVFVARTDPSVIEQPIDDAVRHFEALAAIEKKAANDAAIAEALNTITQKTRESHENLTEVVQDTIQRYGLPVGGPSALLSGLGLGALPMAPFPPTPPLGTNVCGPPLIPLPGQTMMPLPHLGLPSLPPFSFPTLDPSRPMLPPFRDAWNDTTGSEPGPLPPFPDWNSAPFAPQPPPGGPPPLSGSTDFMPQQPPSLKSHQSQQQLPQLFSLPPFPPLPPLPPLLPFPQLPPPPPFPQPPPFPLPPQVFPLSQDLTPQLLNQSLSRASQDYLQQPFPPQPPNGHLPIQPPTHVPAPRKPRDFNPSQQQEYEAHIEWRKANEPGYALKCKERQARRSTRLRGTSEASANFSELEGSSRYGPHSSTCAVEV